MFILCALVAIWEDSYPVQSYVGVLDSSLFCGYLAEIVIFLFYLLNRKGTIIVQEVVNFVRHKKTLHIKNRFI